MATIYRIPSFRSTASRRAMAGAVVWLSLSAHPARAMHRPVAARPLRVTWGDPQVPGSEIAGDEWDSSSHDVAIVAGKPDNRGTWTLYFTRANGGSRNLWRAVPIGAQSASEPIGSVKWRATPLTDFRAPDFADQPVPSHDGTALYCITNQLKTGDSALPQVARLNVRNGIWTALTDLPGHNSEPAISEGDRRLAFCSDASGLESVYVMSPEGGTPTRVATMARHPFWVDDDTLIFEGTRPGHVGLYRLRLPRQLSGADLRPSQLLDQGGKVCAGPDGQQLVVAVEGNPTRRGGHSIPGATQLYCIAADGSGARSVPGTTGARNPCFLPDGSGVLYDAPAPDNEAKGEETRALWLLPMVRVPPTAILEALQAHDDPGAPAAGALDVLGTAFAEGIGGASVRLECGEGAAPRQWAALTVTQTPVHDGVLATWRPPQGARGDWTLRLSVIDGEGDSAQSTLAVTLPIVSPTLPSVEVAPFDPSSLQPAAPPGALATPPPIAGALPVAPLPPLPPPPAPNSPMIVPAPLPDQPIQPPKPRRRRHHPKPPVASPNAESAGAGRPASGSSPVPPPVKEPAPLEVPTPTMVPVPTVVPVGDSGSAASVRTVVANRPKRRALGSGEGARILVLGTPTTLRVGQSVTLQAGLRNLGTETWNSDDHPVRLVYRWYDAIHGWRARWAVQWLSAGVAPGEKVFVPITLTAPARAGTFRLTYSLVRADGTHLEAPPAKGADAPWPGELAAASVMVEVR